MTTACRKKQHKLSRSPTYVTWSSMKSRTSNPRQNRWSVYKNVSVCSRWMEFKNFYADMGERPEGMSIDRIDNFGNYSCGKCKECVAKGWEANCRWATPQEQVNNSRSVKLIEIDGESRSIAEWARRTGISQVAIAQRVKGGMSLVDAITMPKRERCTGELHHQARLTAADVLRIRCLAESGVPQGDIASEFSISRCTVSAIKTRRIWKGLE